MISYVNVYQRVSIAGSLVNGCSKNIVIGFDASPPGKYMGNLWEMGPPNVKCLLVYNPI